MLIGIIGAPNKGKSTLFSALTMIDVEIANRPFTTIDPNLGVTYVTTNCPEKEYNIKCNPRNSLCIDGKRHIPIKIIDVAGLVEGAHEGKGMGNKFLNEIVAANSLIFVVDGSGRTDSEGNPSEFADPNKDMEFLKTELVEWFISVIKRNLSSISKSKDTKEALYNSLTGIGATKDHIDLALKSSNLFSLNSSNNENDIKLFSEHLLKISKPYLIAFNKYDSGNSKENFQNFKEKNNAIECSAAIELALKKAAKSKLIKYIPGNNSFEIIDENISTDQKSALLFMEKFLKENGTNVQKLINKSVFEILGKIVVYPVEDEGKLSDNNGNKLPDAILLDKNSTAQDLAYKIHTDIGKKMLYAMDARTKMRLAKDHKLKNNDIVKIVTAA